MGRYKSSLLLVFLASATIQAQIPTNAGQQSLSPDLHDLDIWLSGEKLTQAEVANAEGTLATSPDDPSAHLKLTRYYCSKYETATCAPHLFWLVDHRPESPLFVMPTLFLLGRDPPAAFVNEWEDHWKRAVAAHQDDAFVLDHAASAIRSHNPNLGSVLVLLRKVVGRNPSCSYPEPTGCRTHLGGLYASALINFERDIQCAPRTPDEERLLAGLRNDLKSINEPLVLFSAASLLKAYSHAPKCGPDLDQNNQLGLELVSKAMAVFVGMTEEEIIRNFGVAAKTTTEGDKELLEYPRRGGIGMIFTVVLQQGKVVELR